MQDCYVTFEFHKIKEALFEFSKTGVAREWIEELEMFSNIEEVKTALGDLEEMSSLIRRFGPLPISTSTKALYLIELAKKTSLLTPRDLHLIAEDVLTSKAIVKYLSKVDVSYPRIKGKTEKFFDLTSLEKEIHRVINSSLAVDDKASTTLKEIRGKIRKAEQTLNQKIASLSLTYARFLNSDSATIRDGHFVLPVKTTAKSSVPGIIYDVSDSGNTTFIEPMEVVQLNNQLTALKVEENEEIRRILKQLTALVLLQEDEIITNNLIIGELDFLSAKSLYASQIDGVIAKINDKQQIIDLVEARHPLIDPRKVVSNSYHLDDEGRILVISGPNAGGKTVSLKTVGISVLMNQCGLAVPALKAELGYFKHIYIDIGDNQSLSDNLSTFSAHMSQLGEITQLIKGKDLVLIDELGTGTDPREGEALAFAIMKRLEDSHALAMISSHFNALKEYAFLSKVVVNSSMVFDEDNLLPTYRFLMGVPGQSYALDVAYRYGISDKIVKDAKEYLSKQGGNETSELLTVLQNKLDEANKLLEKAKIESRRIESEQKKLDAQQNLMKERRENLLSSVNAEKKQIIEKARQEVQEILSTLSKNKDMKVHDVIELKKQLDELEEVEEVVEYNETLKVKDYVSIPSLNMNGYIEKIKGNKAYISSDSGMSFKCELNKLHKIDAPKARTIKPQKTNYEATLNTTMKLELNLIGLRVDEAREQLEKYIDNCLLKRLSTVRIIHGFGSGALRKMTREYLDSKKIKYRPGDASEGAGGATVVLFHD